MRQPEDFVPPIPLMSQRDHLLGSANAPVILMEYGDFQCSESGKMYPILRNLTQQLQSLCFVFRHYPQPDLHPRAQIAAETAEAAGSQSKFWEMHTLLFEHQDALEDADLLEYAIALELDIPRFLQELTDRVHLERIQQDVASAQAHGVNKTPTFFIAIRYHDPETLVETVTKILEFVTVQ